MSWRSVLVALLLTSALSSGVAPATDTGPKLTVLNPDDLRLGDTQQSIAVVAESLTASTTLVVDLTPLADAGADLSNASAAVGRVSADSDATALIERSDGRVRLRVSIDPTAAPTDARLRVGVRGIDATNATPTDLRYDATFDGRSVESDPFRVNDPAIPELSRVMSPETPVVGDPAATQHTRLILLGVPASETTVTVDLAALERANASLRGATVTAAVALPDRGVTLRTVDRTGHTVTLVVAPDTARDRIAIGLVVSGIDTRGATPTTGLRYPITAVTPAGSTTVESEAFGLYPPGETPTPTATPVSDATPSSPSPTTAPVTDGNGSGFGVDSWLVAAALTVAVAAARATRA